MPKFQQIAANIDFVSVLLARLDGIEADTTALQNQITDNLNTMNTEFSTITGQISTINTTLGNLQTQINTINSRLTAAGIP